MLRQRALFWTIRIGCAVKCCVRELCSKNSGSVVLWHVAPESFVLNQSILNLQHVKHSYSKDHSVATSSACPNVVLYHSSRQCVRTCVDLMSPCACVSDIHKLGQLSLVYVWRPAPLVLYELPATPGSLQSLLSITELESILHVFWTLNVHRTCFQFFIRKPSKNWRKKRNPSKRQYHWDSLIENGIKCQHSVVSLSCQHKAGTRTQEANLEMNSDKSKLLSSSLCSLRHNLLN